MKKQFKILLIVACVALLVSAFAIIAFANSTIVNDAKLKNISVSAGGSVKINFVYNDLGSATKMVAEIYAPGAAEASVRYEYDVNKLASKTVSVPLAPSQMNYTVTVHAEDAEGRRGAEKSYSVCQYANAVLANDAYADYHNSMRTLLNWGAMAEIYFSDTESSSINEDYYSRGTNPVNDVVEFCEAEGAVNDGELIDVAGWQLILAPGDTTMRFYFDYAGGGRLSAYVQKENAEQVATGITRDEETGLYCVNIHNLGVAVYDKNYTVTVSDGTDTASITKNAIEYLNTIAFSSDFTSKQNDLAKSMYQFYTHALDKVGACDHTGGLYSAYVDDTTEEMVCSNCMETVYTFPTEIDYYSNISHTTMRDLATNTVTRAQNYVEDGFLFARSTPVNGGLTETTLSLGSDVQVGRYIFIKYRVSDKATGDMKITIQSGNDTSNVYTSTIPLKDVQTKGWMIASVNIERHAFRTEHTTASDLKITIQHCDTLDIAWAVMEEADNNSIIRESFLEDGETYHYWGTYFSNIEHGKMRDKNGNAISDIQLVKTVGASETTYKYVCTVCNGEKCGFVDGHPKTFANTVFNADISAITTTGATAPEMRSENGMPYVHVATGGNTTTTTITSTDVTIGWAMFLKYRLNNGSTPTGSLRVQIEYVYQGTKKVVLNGEATAADVAKRHTGWIIDRVNCKGGVTTNTALLPTLQPGWIADSITITIVHKDDIDIAYFFSDPDKNEKNANVFPQMVRDGDIYYINSVNSSSTGYFGAYSINQWRQITNASTGATSKPGSSETAANLWPNPYNTTPNCKYGHTIVLDAGTPATCTETGLTNGSHCSLCGEILEAQIVIPVRSHVAGRVVIENTSGGSCLEGGSYDEVTYCGICNAEMSRNTVETGVSEHTPVTDAAVAPTCTNTGLTEGSHCGVCGEIIVAQTTLPKAEHSSVVIPTAASTCYSEGSVGGEKCSVCDEILVAPTITPVSDHVYEVVHTDSNHVRRCKTCKNLSYSNNTSTWTMNKTTNGSTTTYSYSCSDCGYTYGEKTLSNDVYYADITGITSTGITNTSATVSTLVESGMVYTHVSTDGDKVTTTFTAKNVPLGIALFFKYRLANGYTPMGNFNMKVVYKYGDKTITVSGTDVLVGALADRHQGWVIGRVNATSAIKAAGITIENKTVSGMIADSVTVTIVHSDDLDIAFLMTDAREDNTNVFGQMLEDGDVYYMHQNLTFASYIDNQWRKVTSSSTNTSISDSSLVNLAVPGSSVADNAPKPDVTEDFSRVESTNASPYVPKVSYGVTVNKTNYELADTLNAAANLNMFDSDLPIRIDYVHEFTRDETVQFTIVDYYGEVIYREYFTGTKGQKVKLAAGFVDHPTGYFTIKIDGAIADVYTVTPSLADRTVTDSPFAMDSASVQRISTTATPILEYYAAAMRLTGVTWVRERMNWSSYQTVNNGDGTYGYNETYLNTLRDQLALIKGQGVNVLLTFSTAPTWATTLAQGTSGGSGITASNFLGTYGTQLAVYDATKTALSVLGNYVDVIELMNEPDHYQFLDLAEQYTAWFKSAALGVVDAGYGTKISLSGMCQPTTWSDFTSIVLSSDSMKYASIYNYHSHASLPTSAIIPDLNSTEAPVIKTITSTLDVYGVTKPVWITESGMAIPSFASEKEKAQQAPYIVTSAAQALSYGTDKYFWFISSFYTESDGDNFSSFGRDHKPYPTIAAYSVMTSVLGEGKYAGDLKISDMNVRGYLFKTGNGDEMAAVIWRTSGSSTYTFSSSTPVLMTNMMGQEQMLNPTDGKISVTVSTNPIYLTYTTAPDYYAHEYDDAELAAPELSLGDHVVITPEFQGATFNSDTKEKGHEIGNGTVINVRVTNHSDVTITGKVSASITGYTVNGTNTEVTVAPHSEAYIQLTLTGSSNVNDLMKFTGTFTDGNTTFSCTPAVAHVYKGSSGIFGDLLGREIEFSVQSTLNKSIAASNLSSVKVKMSNYNSKYSAVIYVDGQRVDGIASISSSWSGATLTMNLSSLTAGKHVISIGLVSAGGDVQSYTLYVRHDGSNVIITTDW